MACVGPQIEALRKKNAVPDIGSSVSGVKSTVGIVFDGKAVSMCVPGGPAFKALSNGHRIKQGDVIVKIDDQQVTADNMVPLLRGADIIGSSVKIVIQIQNTETEETFKILRSDIRQVAKLKDLYMKLAEMQAEARASRADQAQVHAKDLESLIGVVTDWSLIVETSLRAHVGDLETLGAEYLKKCFPRLLPPRCRISPLDQLGDSFLSEFIETIRTISCDTAPVVVRF
jgi:hypothetical protein